MQEFLRNLLIYVFFMNIVRSFVNCVFFMNCAIGCDLRSILQNRTIA